MELPRLLTYIICANALTLYYSMHNVICIIVYSHYMQLVTCCIINTHMHGAVPHDRAAGSGFR